MSGLSRLDRSIDFYLLHGLNGPFWENLSALGVTDFLDDAIADERIRYAGFSFHDNTKVFKEIVKSYDWTFAQIRYNFMDEHYQAGTKGLKYAAKKGLGIVVMEPIGAVCLPGILLVSQRSGRRQTSNYPRRMGAPLGLEPSGSDRRPLRNVGPDRSGRTSNAQKTGYPTP